MFRMMDYSICMTKKYIISSSMQMIALTSPHKKLDMWKIAHIYLS